MEPTPEHLGDAFAAHLPLAVDPGQREVRVVTISHPQRSQAIPDLRDEAQPADGRRLVRTGSGETDNPPLGHIVVFRHGGTERPVVTRGGLHLRFRMPSVKTGMTEVGEGRGEELLAMQCEVDGDIVQFKCHPYKFDIAFGGPRFTYRPDLAILYRDGRIEIVEVKRTPDDLSTDDKVSLARVREFVRRCGWEFSIRYLEDIRGSRWREHNVANIFGRRAMALTHDESSRAQAVRAKMQQVRWGDLISLVAPHDRKHGNAVVERLIAGGMFIVDFDARFDDRTILRPTTIAAPRALPGFEEIAA